MKHLCCAMTFLLSVLCGLRGRAQAEIMAFLESPAQNQATSGISVISGWAFSTTTGAQITVRLRIDGQDFGPIPCCGERQDVGNQFSSFPQALTSGFGQVFNFNLLTDGPHAVTVEVQDNANSTPKVEEHQITVVRPGGFAFLSALSILLANASIENQQVVLDEVDATDKDTQETRKVKVRLAWQVNTQSLGIVASEAASSTMQSIKPQLQPQITETTAAQIVGTTSDPLITNLENPPETRTVSGLGVVSGWTFPPPTGATIASVRLRLDGTAMGAIPCCSERRDVAAAHPDFPQALQSGFGVPFNFNLLTSGAHTVGVDVQSSAGASQTIDHQVAAIKLGDFEFIDNFDLSEAVASIDGVNLFLENVKIRDKATQEIKTIAALFAWQDSCQCFVAQGNCGNGSIESVEECDGTTFGGATCSSLGFSQGTLTCSDICQLTTTECAGGRRVYVTNVLSNTVSVLDTADNIVSATIPVGREPRGIAFKPDGTVAYVSNFRDNTVSIVDPTTNTVTGTVTVGKGPTGVAFAPDGTKAYVVNGRDNTVSVINTETREIITNISVGEEPQNIALFPFPDGTRGYVTNFADNSVTVLDTIRDVVMGDPIAVQEGPNGLALTPDGGKVYVANFSDDSLSIINTENNEVRHLTSDDGVGLRPVKVAVSPNGRRAYVSASLGVAVNAIDTATDTVLSGEGFAIGFVDEEPDGLVITPNGLRAYVAVYGRNGDFDVVLVFSTVTGGLIAPVEVGQGPFALAVEPPRQ
jgi:YVTN family beta-propeller protein